MRGSSDRTLAFASLEGSGINAAMVEQGYAWCYRKYLTDQACLGIEDGARRARRGLWVDALPAPPWEFRRK